MNSNFKELSTHSDNCSGAVSLFSLFFLKSALGISFYGFFSFIPSNAAGRAIDVAVDNGLLSVTKQHTHRPTV